MANFYYVKSGGTATGDAGRVATTPSTGSFATKGASAYYDQISDALAATTPPVDGDFILCSDAHAKVHTGAKGIAFIGGVNQTVMSVSDTNCDQYSAGASESVLNGASQFDFTMNATGGGGALVAFKGMTISAADDLLFQGLEVYWYFEDCELIAGACGAGVPGIQLTSSDGQVLHVKDSTIEHQTSGGFINTNAASRFIFDNVSAGGAHVKISPFFDPAGNGGCEMFILNSDLDSIISASGTLINALAAADDKFLCEVHGCHLPTSLTFIGGTPTLENYEFWLTESGSADEYYYSFYEHGRRGQAEIDTAQYVSSGADQPTYDGTNPFSIQIDTGAVTLPNVPFRYKLKTFPAVDLTTAQTISVECTGSASMTDNDYWIEVEIQDTTDQALRVRQTTRNADAFAAGSALTSGAATWVTTTATEYTISKDLGAQTGLTNSNVTVYFCVGNASDTVNVSMPTIAAT